MADNEYVVEEQLSLSDLVDKIIEPIVSLVILAVLYFFGIDWLLDPITSFLSQFDWFGAAVALVDRLFSMIEWLPPFNGNDDPSLPFGLTLPFGASTIDAIFTLAELVIGIAVIVEALDTSILTVRSEGVTMWDVSVPWSSIQQVVIAQPQTSASESNEVEVGLRLVPDASPPEDLSSLDTDSSTPSEISSPLSTFLDSQLLDRERLVTAVHDFAPENVSIIEVQGNTERELDPQDNDMQAECQTATD